MARQVLALQVVLVAVLVLGSLGLALYDARRDARDAATQQAVSVARALADSPAVIRALRTGDPSATLQPYAEQVRRDTRVDFVVVMDTDGTRYTHPDPENIGEQFIGDLGRAPEGEVFTQEFTGTLGPSMRAVVPVVDDQEVVALVSAGITVERIDSRLQRDLWLVLVVAALVLGVGLGGAWLVSRRLRRLTHGLGEQEITRMYEYYSAVLHAVREGLLLVDDEGRVQLVNDEARRLLDLPDEVRGRSIHDLGLAPGLVDAALGRRAESDEIYTAGDHLLLVSSAPASWGGRDLGAVVTLRDHTELRSVTGQLDVVRGLTDTLHAQNHESANRLHTVVALLEMGRPDDAVAVATEELRLAQQLTDRVVSAVGDPVVAALLLGKTAEASERGVVLTVTGDLPEDGPLSSRDLVTVLGNLLDNAFDAVAGVEEKRVAVTLAPTPDGLTVLVEDSGPGLTEEEARRVLERGWTTKATGDADGRGLGLALVGQVARRHRGRILIDESDLGGAAFAVEVRGVREPV